MGRFTDHRRVEKNRAYPKQDDFSIRGISPGRGGTSDRARGGGYNRGRGRGHDAGRGDHESSRGSYISGRGGFDNNRGGYDNSRGSFHERGRGGRGRGRGRGGYRDYNHQDEPTHDNRKGMVQIVVSGILDSAVAGEPDRGLSKCREWLQEKANVGYKQPRDYVQFKFVS